MHLLLLWICFYFILLQCQFSSSVEIRRREGKSCSEVLEGFLLPCSCSGNETSGTFINCDSISFLGDFPVLPHRSKIISFSQSGSGLQSLEAQLFTASDIPLQRVDFSNNLLRRITERTFDGIEDTITEINLSNNKLGDQLNLVFSTGEFQSLSQLKYLDLSGNEIKEFQSGVFNGLQNLLELKLDRNFIVTIPRSAIQNLISLQKLHFQANYILDIGIHTFPNLTKLQLLNLSSNDIVTIQDGSFESLSNLQTLILSNNQIKSLGSGFLYGLDRIIFLDLSQNLLEQLNLSNQPHSSLKSLILYANKIKSISQISLNKFPSLEYLDLRRNRIFEVPPNVFLNLEGLKHIYLDVNAIRKISTGMFMGLENVSDLTLNDNRILAFPSEPLTVFKNLRKLSLDYNRIAAISKEILSPVKDIKELSLSFNLISEIPDDTFTGFGSLELLNLHGNKISNFSWKKTKGLENSLLYLDIGYNEITSIPQLYFSNLLIFSVAKNKIASINSDAFASLTKIIYLNMSYNMLTNFTPDLFHGLSSMQHLDLQHNRLSYIPHGAFKNLSLVEINLKNNQIKKLTENCFENLMKLTQIDLSHNEIEIIQGRAFNKIPNIELLNLKGNRITVFRGDEIIEKTRLHTMILSNNKISYLYPKSFLQHSEIEYLDLSFNELTFFAHETVNSLKFLTRISLDGNKLHSIGNGYFSNMPNLKQVDLQNNAITSVSNIAFQNSSNLRKIYLQNNQITSIQDNTFIALNRLELDLSYNNLTNLPSHAFSRAKGLKLEAINLSGNRLKDFPNEALKRQYSFLEKVNISYNKISSLPSNADILVNVKVLDVSYNPLLPEAHHVLFGEPKSVRKLIAQGVGVTDLPTIECPFLRHLNLKENQISEIKSNVFDRTSMLSNLDFSYNMIPSVSLILLPMWMKLSYLQTLDLSANPIRHISKSDFTRLLHLRHLRICNLSELLDVNCESLQSLSRLRKLQMHGFPLLQQIYIEQCLQNLTGLELLEIEMKDSHLKGQLQAVFSPKLETLSVSGERLNSISSSAFAGMLSSVIKIMLIQTSVDTFNDKIFIPLPLSSRIEFSIPNNKIEQLTSEMLSLLDNKQIDLVLYGVNSNPLKCDCHMQTLWHWLQDKNQTYFSQHQGYTALKNLQCYKPDYLKGQLVRNVKFSDFICNETVSSKSTEKITDATSEPYTPSVPMIVKETKPNWEHPLIIFEHPVTKKPTGPFSYVPASGTRSTLTKVDTMIIGIVAGVVAFVCILIIIICIIRLRRAHPLYTAGPLAGPLAFRAQGKCTCLKPPPNNCTCYPMYSVPYPTVGRPSLPSNYQHKMLPAPPGFLATAGQSGRLRNTPYYVTYPDSDNENK